MKSVRTEQFKHPVAITQEEYNTLFAHIDLSTELAPATVMFQLTPEELAYANANGGKLYYQQCMFRGVNKDGNGYEPANKYTPMSIHVKNPLTHCPDLYIEELLTYSHKRLREMFTNPEIETEGIISLLIEQHGNGERFIRVTGCDNFCPEKGCLGHG